MWRFVRKKLGNVICARNHKSTCKRDKDMTIKTSYTKLLWDVFIAFQSTHDIFPSYLYDILSGWHANISFWQILCVIYTMLSVFLFGLKTVLFTWRYIMLECLLVILIKSFCHSGFFIHFNMTLRHYWQTFPLVNIILFSLVKTSLFSCYFFSCLHHFH
jgi:hypothetical protein